LVTCVQSPLAKDVKCTAKKKKMLNVEAGFVANILVLPDLVVLFLISALFCLFGILCYMNCFVGGIF
jgi:hypothetical protein